MSPIKKFVLCLAAASIALTIITSNILSSVYDINAWVNLRKNQQAYEQQVADHNDSRYITINGSGNNGGSSNGVTPGGSSGGNGSSQNNQNSSNDKTPAGDNNNGGSEGSGAANAEGLKMYVDALNKAKTSSSKVTRVRTNASNYKGHVKAGMLSSIAKSLMGTFMKEDTTHVDIDKNDLPPKGNNCTLDMSAVESVEVQKNGDKTVVTIVTKAESNPKVGSGIGSAISIIEEKTITDAVAGVIEISNIKLDYDPCKIVATIDASGNLVELYVQAPCILSLSAMGIDAEVGIDCEDEYVIAY